MSVWVGDLSTESGDKPEQPREASDSELAVDAFRKSRLDIELFILFNLISKIL